MKKQAKNGAVATNRKWHLVLLVIAIATIGLFAPPLLSVWLFGAKQPLVLITGAEYVSLITLVVSAYFGANVMHRHVETRNLNAWQQNTPWQQNATWQQMEEATSVPTGATYGTEPDDDDRDKEA